MDVNGVLLSHELPSLSNNSDEGIIKKYEPAKFDFLTMSVGNDDQPKEYGSVDEFIQSSLNEPNSNGIEDEPELVGNSPKPEEAKPAGKKRGRQPKSPKDKPKSVPSSPPVAKKRRRSSGTNDSHPKPVLVEENFREYKLPFGWIKTAHRRKNGQTAGNWDIYLISPSGQRLRSNPEIKRFLKKNPNMPVDHELTKVGRFSDLDELELRQPKRKSKIDAAVIGKITTTNPEEPLVPPVANEVQNPQNDFAAENPQELIEIESGKSSVDKLVEKKPSKKDKKKVKKLKNKPKKKVKKVTKKAKKIANVENLTSNELTQNVFVPTQVFECTNCMNKFPTIQDLKQHVDQQSCFQSLETSDESLIQAMASSELATESQIPTKKAAKKSIRCSLCQFVAKNKNGMVDHMIRNHEDNDEDEVSNMPPGPKSRKKMMKHGLKTKAKSVKKSGVEDFELNPSHHESPLDVICPYQYADKSI